MRPETYEMQAMETLLSNCDQNVIRRSREHVENISRQATGHSVKYVVRTHVLWGVAGKCSCVTSVVLWSHLFHSLWVSSLLWVAFWSFCGLVHAMGV